MREITGRCLCGDISYRAGGAMVFVACQCRDCRYVSGGAAANVLLAPTEQFAVLTGADLVQGYAVEAESGRKVTREFCSRCGTPLFERLEMLEPHSLLIKVGTVDDQSDLRTEATVWAKSAPAWAAIDERAPAFEDNPPDEFIGQALAAKSSGA